MGIPYHTRKKAVLSRFQPKHVNTIVPASKTFIKLKYRQIGLSFKAVSYPKSFKQPGM
jgi:hypothetical protein